MYGDITADADAAAPQTEGLLMGRFDEVLHPGTDKN